MWFEPRPEGTAEARALGPNCQMWHPSLLGAYRGLPDASKYIQPPSYGPPQVVIFDEEDQDVIQRDIAGCAMTPGRTILAISPASAFTIESAEVVRYVVTVIYQDRLVQPQEEAQP